MINEWPAYEPGPAARIRVAFFAEILTEGLDGAVRTMYQLINRIDKSRFEFLFIYGDGPDAIDGFESIQVPTLKLPSPGYSLALPALAEHKVKKALQQFAPQVIHIATPSMLGVFGLNYATAHRVPVISIYHTHFISYIDYYFKYAPFLIRPVKGMVEANHRGFYNRCSKIYVPSESMRGELSEMGVKPNRMQLWKRGIDTQLFSPAKRDKAALHKLTGNTLPTILFASRLVWEKNLETLFAVYDLFKQKGPRVNFVIAGDGVAAKASKSRMPDAVFTGKVGHNQLAVLYASADVFLFPSVSETYGNVVLEAMASGLPCVIADGGGSADFIEQGVNGFKCEPYNAQGYADKINLLLADDAIRAHFVKQGLAYSQSFSWNELATRYFDDLALLAERKILAAV
ncbi:glycosyltransferase family 4 protein [Mucilaginibacter pedocola]|uniref:Alpha-D-mannose-alpha,1-6-phosphatidyl myo-inositol monomannoside transferase n=1 Tax=Mucilaginibacter pedocola TaxID=1792845 RepID=A0A1S9PI60_9SPHI|nr:glycosyltransferase family 1 protein [Mucilaginibacter pedocola]OOQ60661.1 alpha-D-mannose-alpha,1-6-phosphatidyl myo-inositol monomannoside transferase [Mucilaginibacter pedocola]